MGNYKIGSRTNCRSAKCNLLKEHGEISREYAGMSSVK